MSLIANMAPRMQIIKTPADLGQIIRSRRKELRLNQAQLAAQIGVSRQWLIDIEKGKSRAELGLILRAIYALGLSMHLDRGKNETTQRTSPPDIDLDAIVERSKRSASPRFRNDVFSTADIHRLIREQNSAVEVAKKQFSAGIPDDFHRLMQEQSSAVELAKKQLSAGIPDDIHRLMREQNNAVELAKQLSSGIPDDIHTLMRESKRNRKSSSAGGKTR